MKNVVIILFLFFGIKCLGQGSDIIFWIDNSKSMSQIEYDQTKTRVQNIMHDVLECDPNNRVAVVQYGGHFLQGQPVPDLWIESDFTNDESIASNFIRRSTYWIGSDCDIANEALEIIGGALDGQTSFWTESPQKTLSHSPSKSLVILLFSDADKYSAGACSYLISRFHPQGGDIAFSEYTNFKNLRDATFMVMMYNQNSIYTAGAIASSGGPSTYAVEYYPADPDTDFDSGSGVTSDPFGRYLYMAPAYSDTYSIGQSICNINCEKKITVSSPIHDVSASATLKKKAGFILAENVIHNSGTAIYQAGQLLKLNPGFHSKVGSKLRGYIDTSCNDGVLFENNPISNDMYESKKTDELLSIYPNPSTYVTTIQLERGLLKDLIVTSIEGMKMFESKVNTQTFELSTINYKSGVYIVTVETDEGEILTKKLVKN